LLCAASVIRAKTEAVRTSETSDYFNETTHRYIPEGCHLHTRRRESLKSHIFHLTLQFRFWTCNFDSRKLNPLGQQRVYRIAMETVCSRSTCLLIPCVPPSSTQCAELQFTLSIQHSFHSLYTFLNPFIYHNVFLLCVKWLCSPRCWLGEKVLWGFCKERGDAGSRCSIKRMPCIMYHYMDRAIMSYFVLVSFTVCPIITAQLCVIIRFLSVYVVTVNH
jgi:hypothetical protein